MAAERYKANWRSARRYQFDEDARKIAAARKPRRVPQLSPLNLPVALLLGGAAGLGYFAEDLSGAGMASYALSLVSPSCTIKGNVSIDSGEHIYHVPGQEYYDQTRISPQYGERWFCSEAEARAAGWRKAGY
jgi:hypothetical protein